MMDELKKNSEEQPEVSIFFSNFVFFTHKLSNNTSILGATHRTISKSTTVLQ